VRERVYIAPSFSGRAVLGDAPPIPSVSHAPSHTHGDALERSLRRMTGPAHRHSGVRMPRSFSAIKRPRRQPHQGNRGQRERKEGEPGEKRSVSIPPLAEGAIRIVPLGGVEEVGKNMTAIEYRDTIIVIDAGFQFREEETPGIDYILPNTKYLEERKHRVKALFITHGHLDHIGAIPYLMERIGNPPVYTRQFGAMMIEKRQEEFPHVPKLNVKVLDGTETVRFAPDFSVETFPISHTIPDSMGLIIHTPAGPIVFIEDVRVDNVAGVPTEEEHKQYERFANMDVLLLTMDSTSIEKPGFSLSEQTVVKNIERIIREAPSRLIIATFASQVERILAIINVCRTLNKKVIFEGRSMKTNLEIIKHLKLVDTDGVVVPLEEIEHYPPDRIVMIVTGGQGEEFAALMRMANKTHKQVRLRTTDTIVLSSSIIPTNYHAVVNLKDNLYRSEAKIITYLDSDVHASGHGNRDELRWIHDHIKYRYFIPLHGNHYMLRQHAELAFSRGVPKENVVVPDNGSIIEITDNGTRMRTLSVKAPSNPVMVDGFAVGDMQEVVLRDRQMLAEEGMFVIIASINSSNGKLKKSPDIISRGFVYLRESQDLLHQTRIIIKKTIEDTTAGMHPINFEYVKEQVTDAVSRYLFQKTAKRPIVIPVLLGV
jgi:ribonuclease J